MFFILSSSSQIHGFCGAPQLKGAPTYNVKVSSSSCQGQRGPSGPYEGGEALRVRRRTREWPRVQAL